MNFEIFMENLPQKGFAYSENNRFYQEKGFFRELYVACLSSCKDKYTPYKISDILKLIPEVDSKKEIFDSINYNLNFNFNNFNFPLPEGFKLLKTGSSSHVGNINQHHITFDREDLDYSPSVATIDFYFLHRSNAMELRINNLQGNLKVSRGWFDKREISGIFGKLSNFYGKNWRAGLAEKIKSFGEQNKMRVVGEMPLVFYFFNSSIPEYTRYSLYYLQSFLEAGITLEGVDFRKVHENFVGSFDNLKTALKDEKREDQISFLRDLIRENNLFLEEQKSLWFKGKISSEELEKKVTKKFKEIVEI